MMTEELNEISLDWTLADLIQANPQEFLFHWAPISSRSSIQREGLRRNPQPQLEQGFQAVYLTSAPREWESDSFRNHELWLIDVRGITLFFDPEMLAYRRDFLTTESIPADRVILYEDWQLLYG